MVYSVAPEFEKRFFDEFAAVPTYYSSFNKGVRCLIRVQGGDHSISIESKNIFRRFWIWLTGTKEEYNLKVNLQYVASKIQGGIRKITEGPLDSSTEKKIVACYKRYQLLVTYYAWHHNERNFSVHEFEERYLSLPLDGLLCKYDETLQSWEKEGTDIQKIIAQWSRACVEDLKYRIRGLTYESWIETHFPTYIRTLFSHLEDATHVTACSPISDRAWLEKMEGEKGYPRMGFDIVCLKNRWEDMTRAALRSPLENSFNGLKSYLEERVEKLHAQRLVIQEKLDEFLAEEKFAKWEQEGNEGKRLFAKQVRYYLDRKKERFSEEGRHSLPKSLSWFRQRATEYVDFPDHRIAQRLEDLRRKYDCDLDCEFLQMESAWRRLQTPQEFFRLYVQEIPTVEPLDLKKKLEVAVNELDLRIAQFLRKKELAMIETIRKKELAMIETIRDQWKALQSGFSADAKNDMLASFVRKLYLDKDHVSTLGALFCTGNGSEIMEFLTKAIQNLKSPEYQEIRSDIIHLRKKIDVIVVAATRDADLGVNPLNFSAVLP